MAGSLRNFQYIADNGDIFLFRADESNTEAVNALVANIVAANANRPGIPRGFRMRTLTYGNATRTRSIRCYASTLAIYNAPPATIPDTLGSGNLSLIRKNPERIRIYPNFDTGLDDGDAPL